MMREINMSVDYSAQRIKKIPTSIFSTMSKMAIDYNAVNLGQGFPDFNGAEWIMEAAYVAMKNGKNQYAPSQGTNSLRRSISNYLKKFYDLDVDKDREITITAGATEALYSAIHALVGPGDEVIIFEPYYDGHQADVLLAGGTPVYITLRRPDFGFDPEELRRAVSGKTKMIIINSPHNPSGKVFSREQLEIIAGIATENDLVVLSDEVYEFMTYDDARHIPMMAIDGMHERTVMISSTGKTFGMTGWKIGYAAAAPAITDAIRSVHQWTTYAVNTPAQIAMAHAFDQLDDYLPEFRKSYTQKRDYLYSELQQTKFRPYLPKGSYFMLTKVPEEFNDDVDCARRLVQEQGVATIPPSVFYSKSDEGRGLLRLCFAKREETLRRGVEILKSV
jgi:N-succinyldiaminopimelate aminotransferase